MSVIRQLPSTHACMNVKWKAVGTKSNCFLVGPCWFVDRVWWLRQSSSASMDVNSERQMKVHCTDMPPSMESKIQQCNNSFRCEVVTHVNRLGCKWATPVETFLLLVPQELRTASWTCGGCLLRAREMIKSGFYGNVRNMHHLPR